MFMFVKLYVSLLFHFALQSRTGPEGPHYKGSNASYCMETNMHIYLQSSR